MASQSNQSNNEGIERRNG